MAHVDELCSFTSKQLSQHGVLTLKRATLLGDTEWMQYSKKTPVGVLYELRDAQAAGEEGLVDV